MAGSPPRVSAPVLRQSGRAAVSQRGSPSALPKQSAASEAIPSRRSPARARPWPGGESSSGYSGRPHPAAPDPVDAPETQRQCESVGHPQRVLPGPQSSASSSAQRPHPPSDCLQLT